MNLKEKLPLIIGIGLPILLILFVTVSVYVPSLLVKPKYDFIYSTGQTYDYNLNVVNGKITQSPRYTQPYSGGYKTQVEPTYFIYDVNADKKRPISYTQTQAYNLDSSDKSPDGFSVSRNDSGSYSFFPFFYGGGNDYGIYLKGKGLNRKITDDTYNFKFLGWVTSE